MKTHKLLTLGALYFIVGCQVAPHPTNRPPLGNWGPATSTKQVYYPIDWNKVQVYRANNYYVGIGQLQPTPPNGVPTN